MRTLILALAILLLAGCATGTGNRQVAVEIPEFSNNRTATAAVHLREVRDLREFDSSLPPADPATVIGGLFGSDGELTAMVQLPGEGTVQQTMGELVRQGLSSRGYSLVDDAAAADLLVTVAVDQFWGRFMPAMLDFRYHASVEARLEFVAPGASREFRIQGQSHGRGQVSSDTDWQQAYQEAITEFINQLDRELDAAGY